MPRRRWGDLEWIERFGYWCMAGFVVVAAVLLVMMTLNGCGAVIEPGPTLPPLTTAAVAPSENPEAPPGGTHHP